MTLKPLLYLSVLLASVATAEGPVFSHKDPVAQQEFENVYKDIRGARASSTTAAYINNTATLQTGATFFVSSGTATSFSASTITVNALTNGTGVRIKGTTTNDSATVGDYGEVPSTTTARSNFPASGTWGDLSSKVLTAGDWLCAAPVASEFAATTITRVQFGLSTTSGNSSTGLVEGYSQTDTPIPTASIDGAATIGPVHFQLSGSTTVYLKYKSTYSGTVPVGDGTIVCWRVR